MKTPLKVNGVVCRGHNRGVTFVDPYDIVLTLNKSAAYSQDIGGMTPLHVAAGIGGSSLASKIMVECPDCVEVLDHKGRNFLHIAAFRGQTWMVRRALEHTIMNKGLINGVDNEGNTPLHLASISKAYSTIVLLINGVDNEGNTPILQE